MPNHTFSEEMYVQAFQLARTGLSNNKIARSLGVTPKTFSFWMKKRPALKHALVEGRRSPGEVTRTFQGYIYKQLSPKLRKVWKRIRKCSEQNQIRKMEALLEKNGSLARQQLFIHAFVTYNFNVSRACRAVNVSRKTVHEWVRNDPDFGELLQEMEEYKDDFFEDAFINLIKEGNEKAILAAAKMRLHRKGYGEKRSKDVNVTINSTHHNRISVDDLQLPVDVRQQMLAKHRERMALKEAVPDAEIINK